jgi:hypothetical protein
MELMEDMNNIVEELRLEMTKGKVEVVVNMLVELERKVEEGRVGKLLDYL